MRQRDAGRAVLISSQRQIQSQPSKNTKHQVWVRRKSAEIYRVVTTAAALRRIHECSHAPLSRDFEKASALVHAACAVFVLPHIVLACPVGKRDDANVVWWITV